MSSAWLSSLAKIRVLGTSRAAGEDLGEQLVAEGADDGADLVHRDDVAVELLGLVGEVLVELLPADLAGLPVALVDVETGVDRRAALGDLGADAVDVEVDVHAVGHGLVVVVLHHQVLVEEAKRLLRGRGRQADQVGVEVFQNLAPEVVDRPVALVGEDDVERLDRDRRVVARPAPAR